MLMVQIGRRLTNHHGESALLIILVAREET